MTLRNYVLAFLSALCLLPSYASAQSSRQVKAKFTWDIGNAENTKDLLLGVMLPVTIQGRQQVNSVKFSVKPDEDETDEYGNRYAFFYFTSGNIPRQVVIEADILLLKHGLGAAKRSKQAQPEDMGKYLHDGKFLNMQNDTIRRIATALRGATEDETVKNIMAYISKKITYGKSPNYPRQGALVTLKRKIGICGDYSDLMIALCRANGIPARQSMGFMIDRDFLPGWDGDAGHLWVEVYLKDYGWVGFEPTTNTINGWQTMTAQYIYLSQDMDNSRLNGRYSFKYEGWRPRIDDFFSVK